MNAVDRTTLMIVEAAEQLTEADADTRIVPNAQGRCVEIHFNDGTAARVVITRLNWATRER